MCQVGISTITRIHIIISKYFKTERERETQIAVKVLSAYTVKTRAGAAGVAWRRSAECDCADRRVEDIYL